MRKKDIILGVTLGILMLMIPPLSAEEGDEPQVFSEAISLIPGMLVTGTSLTPTEGGADIHLTLTEKSDNTTVFVSGNGKTRVLHQGPLPAGKHLFMWDGKDKTGKQMDLSLPYTAGVQNEFLNHREGFFSLAGSTE